MSSASHQHGRFGFNLTLSLGQYVRAHALGTLYVAETGVRVATDPDTVLAPDAAFVRRERVEAIGDSGGYWPGAPDLAVEIVSRHDRYTEVADNVGAWLAAGTRMVLVVDPRQRRVTVSRHRLS